MKAVPIPHDHEHHPKSPRIRHRLSARLAACALLALAACGGGGETPGEREGSQGTGYVTIYESDFSEPKAARWFHYPDDVLVSPVPLAVHQEADGNHYAVSKGPWWTDPNHAAPGLGYLHLVAFAYHRDFPGFGEVPDIPTGNRPVDLRNARIDIRWRAHGLEMPDDAQLALWFQKRIPTADPERPRYVNYALVGQALRTDPAADGWQEDTLMLSTAVADYACLGSSPERADTYGCEVAPLDALRDWDTDLGLVILFKEEKMAAEIDGAVELDHLAISVPRANLATHSGPGVSGDGE